MTVDRKLRLSQTITPFGVGAIYDLLGESFVACDTRLWGPHGMTLRLDRLARQLDVSRFRAAPSQAGLFGRSGAGVPYARFPRWLFCPQCRTMTYWRRRDEQENEQARCPNGACPRKPVLVPMRFIAVCLNGHMTDVPWHEWAHSTADSAEQKQCGSFNLAFLSRRQATAGLDSLIVQCRSCKARRSLFGISKADSLKPLEGRFAEAVRCHGTQPWQAHTRGEQCGLLLQVVQRGATNVYFPQVVPALDIPPDSDFDPFAETTIKIRNHKMFAALLDADDGPLVEMMVKSIAGEVGTATDTVKAVLAQDVAAQRGQPLTTVDTTEDEDLYAGEWRAFRAPIIDRHPRSKFITKASTLFVDPPHTEAGKALNDLIDDVALATRLREVRALVGFSRYEDGARLVRPDLGHGLDFLPAIEVFGEGVFIAFNETAVSRWEANDNVDSVGSLLEDRRSKALVGKRLRPASARYVLLHTFAHLLIRQLSFDCGYAAASLRERVYARTPDSKNEPEAGVLIYTAAGDVEGTMGGLVRQGKPPRLVASILRSLERGAWCSADPLCRENPGQGFGALNLAACHACSLLSETSCEGGNRLLDRSVLFGRTDMPGYFDPVLRAGLTEAATSVTLESVS